MAGRPARWTERDARRRHREFWENAHADGWGTPQRPSPLAVWTAPQLPEAGAGRRLLELGFGSGADIPIFVGLGFTVAGVELSRAAATRARTLSRTHPGPEAVPRPILDTGDALEFLATQPDGSASVVFANLFHSMAVPPAAERRRWREVHRVLAPGGLHVFSVRTTDDTWNGVGRPLGPGSFDPGDDGPPLRFFDPEQLRRSLTGRFEPVAQRSGTEGTGRYARTVLYRIDRKRLSPPQKGGRRNGLGRDP